MAGLPPVTGLYVSFFTVVVYILLGTSRHLSIGTYAIVSLMVKAFIDKAEGQLFPSEYEIEKNLTIGNATLLNSHYLSNDPQQVNYYYLIFKIINISIFYLIFHKGKNYHRYDTGILFWFNPNNICNIACRICY
jgi:MFS superfamily sulfate permease-like transporter